MGAEATCTVRLGGRTVEGKARLETDVPVVLQAYGTAEAGLLGFETAPRSGLRVLAEGRVLGIYPEGTRSPDGRLYRGRTGVARLALESRAPVVPCAMMNTFEFLPSGSHNPKFGVRPGVIFGQPMEFSRYYGREKDREALRAVTDEIIAEIAKLSGQEYVNIYAKQAKERAQPDGADTDLSMLSIASQAFPGRQLQVP